VTLRTLRNWCAIAQSGIWRKQGRPQIEAAIHQKTMWLVGRELRKQKYSGWRSIKEVLGDAVPISLLQLYVAKFKARRNKRQLQRIEKHRISVAVLVKNVLWVQDGIISGKSCPEPLDAQIIKDRGSLITVSVKTGSPATGEAVVARLEELKESRGLPFVWGSDNGPCNIAAVTKAFLQKEKIIHLLSLPYTPQHNGGAEIAIREIKHVAELDATVWSQGKFVVQARLEKAAYQLNHGRLRGSKGYKTAYELDETLPGAYNNVRAHFFETCCSRIKQSVAGAKNALAARMAEREAIFGTLEVFGFIKRMRGGRPYIPEMNQKVEVFS
jgi:transposase InsO family protein